MSTPRHRFHDGCWTCKSKRFQCDRTRPHCLACRQRGFACEGYGLRLRWGTGIASRGRFAGASQPVEAAIPERPKGRRRDLVRKERLQEAALKSCDTGTWTLADPSPTAASTSESEAEAETEPRAVVESGCNPSEVGWRVQQNHGLHLSVQHCLEW
jgi:hypothetical protein